MGDIDAHCEQKGKENVYKDVGLTYHSELSAQQ